ncbi:MAG: hypothetical protein ACREM6_14330 [Vulcanimicrobiaceae bacterium]
MMQNRLAAAALWCAALTFALLGRTAAAHPIAHPRATPTPALAALAPADEYFGRFKLSILGIRNVIRDQGLRYRYDHAVAATAMQTVDEAVSSIRDWERKYPHDSDVPRAIYFLDRFYAAVSSDAARVQELATRNWLLADFGKSPQAKQLRKDLMEQAFLAKHRPPPTPAPVDSPAAPAQPSPSPSP